MNYDTINAMIQTLNDEFINVDESSEQLNLPDFYEYGEIKVPRVTKVINTCNPNINNLLSWANHLGFKRVDYKKYMNKASSIGIAIHNAIEGYICDGKSPELSDMALPEVNQSIMNGFLGFKTFWDAYRKNHSIEKVELEQKLITPYFGGTMDMYILEKDGTETIYDFKSSNHIQTHHFIQLAAYKFAMETYQKTTHKISRVGILQLNKYEPLCTEHLLDLSIDHNKRFIDDATMCFISMLYTYFYSYRLENEFKSVIKPRRQ